MKSVGPVSQDLLDEGFVIAAHETNPAMVEWLLAHGADVNTRDRDGRTGLMNAGLDGTHTESERQAIWRVLLRHGADIHPQDNLGNTALHYAAFHGDTALVKELLTRGARVNQPDPRGETPLMGAVRMNNPGAVRLLLAHGADPRVRNREGRSAVDYVPSRGSDIARMLKRASEAK